LPHDPTRVVRALVAAPAKLLEHPRLGERLDRYAPRDVRRLLVGPYEMRYELRPDELVVLRVWHSREER
jgi:plasmid stabilization system protein ParE